MAPREPAGRTTRRRPAGFHKLIWPLSLGVAGLLLYGVFTSGADRKSPSRVDEPEVDLRPAPRVARPAPEPLFVPAQVAATAPPSLAVGVPDAATPPVDQAALDAAREAEEAARRRRMAPLLVPLEAPGQPGRAQPHGGNEVVQDMSAPLPVDAAMAGRAARDERPSPSASPAAAGFAPAVLQVDDPSLDRTILQGKTIPAVLETAVHTALPGQVRAMVNEDVYGESGRQVLIPRMSRLVGEYETARIAAGQSRVMVIWQRAILPDGRSVSLASPGTDGLGRSGMTGEVDNHYLARFGAAFLVSMIGVAAEQAGSADVASSNAAGGLVVIDRTRSEAVKGLQSTVESMLRSQANIPPTIQIAQGSRVRVFVARDLDLSPLAASRVR